MYFTIYPSSMNIIGCLSCTQYCKSSLDIIRNESCNLYSQSSLNVIDSGSCILYFSSSWEYHWFRKLHSIFFILLEYYWLLELHFILSILLGVYHVMHKTLESKDECAMLVHNQFSKNIAFSKLFDFDLYSGKITKILNSYFASASSYG